MLSVGTENRELCCKAYGEVVFVVVYSYAPL